MDMCSNQDELFLPLTPVPVLEHFVFQVSLLLVSETRQRPTDHNPCTGMPQITTRRWGLGLIPWARNPKA